MRDGPAHNLREHAELSIYGQIVRIGLRITEGGIKLLPRLSTVSRIMRTDQSRRSRPPRHIPGASGQKQRPASSEQSLTNGLSAALNRAKGAQRSMHHDRRRALQT